MRVLVTRPAHSGERTAQRLRDLGHEPLLLPLAWPVHETEAALQALTASKGAIAITSAEALRALSTLGGRLTPHLSRPLFAVGEATADAADNLGFRSVITAAGSGRELADLIAAQHPPSLLYLAGSPRAEGFETRLRELDQSFTAAECYRMQPLTPDEADIDAIFADGGPDATLFYSRQTAENFFALPRLRAGHEELRRMRLLCLSEAVATAIPAALRKSVMISPMPDEKSLLSLL